MSKYASIYINELNKAAGLGQIIAPMAKGLISKGIGALTNVAKPALTSVAKVEAPAMATAAGKSIGGIGNSLAAPAIKAEAPAVTSLASKTVSEGTQGLRATTPPATFLPQPAAAPQPATFLPELPQGSTLMNDVHFARTNARQAIDLIRQRGTPTARENAQKAIKDYKGLMGNMSQYNIPGR